MKKWVPVIMWFKVQTSGNYSINGFFSGVWEGVLKSFGNPLTSTVKNMNIGCHVF